MCTTEFFSTCWRSASQDAYRLGWALATLLLLHAGAWAEKSDRDQPTQIQAQRGQYNDIKQTGRYEGNVVLVKGSLRLEGARLDFYKDEQGFEHAVIVGSEAHLATFRQRRDPARRGVEEYVAGQAQRIEYNSREETIKLINQASWHRLENEQIQDEITGKVITYDSRNATYEAQADGQGGDERVRTVIAPRRTTSEPTVDGSEERVSRPEAEGVLLKPATTMQAQP